MLNQQTVYCGSLANLERKQARKFHMTKEQASMLEVGDKIFYSCHVDDWHGEVLSNRNGFVEIKWDYLTSFNSTIYEWGEVRYFHKI